MAYTSTWPYAEVTPDEYLDRPQRSAPGQATPPPAPPRTREESATRAASCRAAAAEYRAEAEHHRAQGDGHRVQALAAESSAAMYERLAEAHENHAQENQP